MKRIHALTFALILLGAQNSFAKDCKKCSILENQANALSAENANGITDEIPLLECLSHPEVLMQTPFGIASLFCCGTFTCSFVKEFMTEPKHWISLVEKASLALVLGFCSNYIVKKTLKSCKKAQRAQDAAKAFEAY